MVKKSILFVLLCFIFSWIGLSSEKPIWPTVDFSANFCNFPQAWSITKGKHITIGIVYDETDKTPDWIKKPPTWYRKQK